MQAPFDNIVQHLFHQPSLHSVTVDELENMAQQHPYFAAAHFLLLKKMQDTDHPQFNTQLHKTTLYFNNPLWLQYLLQPETVADFTVSENAPFISDEPAAIPVAVEQNGNGHTNGHAIATAYRDKEEEVLLEKEQAPSAIDDHVVYQQTDTPHSYSNGGIMDVITEVFNEEHSQATPLPVFEEPASHIHITETAINDNEAVETAGLLSGSATDRETVVAEEIKEPEKETPFETVLEEHTQENNHDVEEHTESIHEELPAEHVTENPEEEYLSEGSQITNIEEESAAAESITGTIHEYAAPENDHHVVDEQTENITEEIPEELNTAPADETLVFANEETIMPVAETPADTHTIVEEQPSSIPEEEVSAESFNEDVTPSVIATIEENNDAVYFHAKELLANNPEEITATIYPVQAEDPVTEHIAAAVTEENTVQNADDTDKTEVSKDTAPDQDKPLFRTIIETPASKHDFLFEPYHTVDYFASQGIKLSKIEANSKDKLGRQLKSFTEWLKSMKRLPQTSIDKILSENEESKVVADAIHSIEKKDVITEAMAEVFEKQGMMNEAAGVYQKLSLLNPAKSAYFAAKIEALKH